jgi:protein-S-isoprenylcysteine O-methyltransferase Ste14
MKQAQAAGKAEAMTITNPLGGLRSRSGEHVPGPLLVLTGAVAAVLAASAIWGRDLSPPTLVPAVSLLFFVLAAAVALIAWRRPLPSRRFSYWDVAGVLTFIGICMGATVEPGQMVELVAGTRSP